MWQQRGNGRRDHQFRFCNISGLGAYIGRGDGVHQPFAYVLLCFAPKGLQYVYPLLAWLARGRPVLRTRLGISTG